jgi:hypothetical protein
VADPDGVADPDAGGGVADPDADAVAGSLADPCREAPGSAPFEHAAPPETRPIAAPSKKGHVLVRTGDPR